MKCNTRQEFILLCMRAVKSDLEGAKKLKFPANSKNALNIKVNMLISIREQLLLVNKQLKAINNDPQYSTLIKLLMSIPGIGWLSAITLLIELEDIRRFKNFDHLCSYVGFKPDIYSSGEKAVVKGITRHCNHLLRETLVECSWMAIGKDPALTQAYYGYKKRMHYNKAIFRIAKKLLSRIRYVLINEQPKVQTIDETLRLKESLIVRFFQFSVG